MQMKRGKLNHILFIHSDIGLHMHACVHVRFTCKKKVVPDRCCQGGVSPYQGMLYNIIHVPPSVSANQMRRYNQN